MSVAVLVPIKPFAGAKTRLAPALSGDQRACLLRAMAERVVAAAGALPVTVACEDDGVASWALERGASVLRVPARGLDHAVEEGMRALAAQGHTLAVVAHADLPLARDLSWPAAFPGVTIVPDRRGVGTNVVSLPTAAAFRFRFGPGSLARHVAEAGRVGLPLRVVHDPRLGWDVDVPDDLAVLALDRAVAP